MTNHLTDNAFWKNFWESKKNLIFKVKPNYTFAEELKNIITHKNIKTAIELGGFPGYYAIFLRKYFSLDTTLFDYYIHQEIIEKLFAENDLALADIKIIEADLFSYEPSTTYDLVSSFGLIEHFQDTQDIIKRHIHFLNDKGTLFITLPNFKGVNGWIQKVFDPYNYRKHYIQCMDIDFLSATAKNLNLQDVQVFYSGGFSTWLENKENKPFLVSAFVKMVWLLGKIVHKILRIESKWLSPYIVLIATK